MGKMDLSMKPLYGDTKEGSRGKNDTESSYLAVKY